MAPLLLESVEQIIGLIEGWPLMILQMLFLDTPDENIIKSVTAFFMGTEFLLIWLIRCMKLVVGCLELG